MGVVRDLQSPYEVNSIDGETDMTVQEQSRPCDVSIVPFQRHVDLTLEQCQRFEEMASNTKAWANHWATAALACWLDAQAAETDVCEQALVALALQATRQSGEVIDAYEPANRDEAHRAFHEVARIEWERRHEARRVGRAAA